MFSSISDDHSRVVLKVSSKENGTGYINANYIHVSVHPYHSWACTVAHQDLVLIQPLEAVAIISSNVSTAFKESWARIGLKSCTFLAAYRSNNAGSTNMPQHVC